MRATLFILTVLLLVTNSFGQDTIAFTENSTLLNTSIADKFTLTEYDGKKVVQTRKLKFPVENLDFTSGKFTIDFVLVNETDETLDLLLETARPITNTVWLFDNVKERDYFSGDAIPFNKKDIASNRSMLPIQVEANSTSQYSLMLESDGEIISLPMIFWEKTAFENQERRSQFATGIFYGIFLFVIIIYLTFYILLRDRLFLWYTIYVLFSGLLQFALDGYMHQYVFTSGGYLTQHSVIIVAGLTVFFALQYATRYLELQGRLKNITIGFAWLVFLTILLSLIPGSIYETCYPLINGFSFLAVAFLLYIAVRIRRRNPNISRLFLLGLTTLLIGAVLFILGNFSIIDAPLITQNSLKAGTLVEIICLSILMAGKYKSLQDEKEEAQKQLVRELEEKNQLVSSINVRLEEEVKKSIKEVEESRKLLKKKNDDFISSIKYAERIQKALLSNEQKFKTILPNSFVIFKPKDIVSGDFYWIEHIQPTKQWPSGLIVYATADCTGHGVPGAFVSIVCNNLLKLGKTHPSVQSPGEALSFVNAEINETLNSEYANEQIRDGMDIALCAIDPESRKLYFSGAKNGVYIVRKDELIEVKGERKGIGYDESGNKEFGTQTVELKQGDLLYTFSDGFIDQFGGPKGKKFGSRQLKQVLTGIASSPLSEQQSVLERMFEEWKKEEEQVDDVLLIGVQII